MWTSWKLCNEVQVIQSGKSGLCNCNMYHWGHLTLSYWFRINVWVLTICSVTIVQTLNPNWLSKLTDPQVNKESDHSPCWPQEVRKGTGSLVGCKTPPGGCWTEVPAANVTPLPPSSTRLPPVAASIHPSIQKQSRVMTQTNSLPLTRNAGYYSPPTHAQSARQPISHALHSLSTSSSPSRPRLSPSLSNPPLLIPAHTDVDWQSTLSPGWGGARACTLTDGRIIASEWRRLAGGQEQIKREERHGGGMKKKTKKKLKVWTWAQEEERIRAERRGSAGGSSVRMQEHRSGQWKAGVSITKEK